MLAALRLGEKCNPSHSLNIDPDQLESLPPLMQQIDMDQFVPELSRIACRCLVAEASFDVTCIAHRGTRVLRPRVLTDQQISNFQNRGYVHTVHFYKKVKTPFT